eukprot:NODE_4749_length_766_cov_53.454672_g4402_i0.p2 GENE.NODE_4749_length_766_cov_53.454672_g4402_i0~~NODE_4749_length_766_cov_53.454672_g4402_i0.p2  ORF type:complete len:145 (+),score=18.05 NODE_4749_length_766_cov_53.454672_g4402_i0:91-525(+)
MYSVPPLSLYPSTVYHPPAYYPPSYYPAAVPSYVPLPPPIVPVVDPLVATRRLSYELEVAHRTRLNMELADAQARLAFSEALARDAQARLGPPPAEPEPPQPSVFSPVGHYIRTGERGHFKRDLYGANPPPATPYGRHAQTTRQ